MLALGTVVVTLALGGCRSETGTDDWVTIRRDDLVLSVEVTARLAAVETDILGPPPVPDVWDFKIAEMASEGKAVKKGDVVLGFDATDLRRQLEKKESELDTATKEVEKQLRQWQR